MFSVTIPGSTGCGKDICGLGSGTATGEVNATASREAKIIDVAAMMCGVMHRFRVSSGFRCNLPECRGYRMESKFEGIRNLLIYESLSSQSASLILKKRRKNSPPICAEAFNREECSCAR